MQYLLLIYGNETYWNKLSEADQGKVSQEYGEFTQSIAGSTGGSGTASPTMDRGRWAYRRALALATNEAERKFLSKRLVEAESKLQ
jgi:hypothetical protein